MSPGNDRGGPRQEAATTSVLTNNTSVTDTSRVEKTEIEPRAGQLVRVTFARTATGECLVCGATFTGTGQAASHARATRHTVSCTYSARFSFIPTETLDGGR